MVVAAPVIETVGPLTHVFALMADPPLFHEAVVPTSGACAAVHGPDVTGGVMVVVPVRLFGFHVMKYVPALL